MFYVPVDIKELETWQSTEVNTYLDACINLSSINCNALIVITVNLDISVDSCLKRLYWRPG
jgi:hypothetical protein